MFAKTMLSFRKQLNREGITFCYSGYMTEELLLGIGSTLKKKMASTQLGKKKSRPVFSVFVEQMQNVIRYSAERVKQANNADLSYGVMAVGEVGYNVFVACGNIVHAVDAARMKADLDKITSLDRQGLKALWKESLKNAPPEGSVGSGVGFIDIARRAKGGLEYEFVKVTPQWFFFTIKAFL